MKYHSLKKRVLLWFGGSSALVLIFFSLAFNYFLNESIENNIKTKLEIVVQDILADKEVTSAGFAIINNNQIVKQNKSFTLKNYQFYLNQSNSFFIIPHKVDDDYINALYIEKSSEKYILIYKTNIDNKIENFQDILLLLVPILLFIIIVLARKMIDKILQPINSLIQATTSTSVSALSQNLELPSDNDEIRTLVVSYNNMIKRLHGGIEQLDRFNSDVSHELRTPLTVIQGEIEITLRKQREPKVYEKSMQTIYEQSKQIESIVEGLLLLTKYSKLNIKESFELCNLDSILLACIDKYEEKLKLKNIHLEIKRIEVVSLNANPILINSIFSNLLDNAIKYTPSDKKIYIELYQDKKIIFTIQDEGIGIAEDKLEMITDKFYRVDESRNKDVQGFGLGLSIVKNAIDLHDGQLIFDSLRDGLRIQVVL